MLLYYIQNQIIPYSAFWVPSDCRVQVRTLKGVTVCVSSFLPFQTIRAPIQSYLLSIPLALSFPCRNPLIQSCCVSSHDLCFYTYHFLFLIISVKIRPTDFPCPRPQVIFFVCCITYFSTYGPYDLLALSIFVSSHSLCWNLTVRKDRLTTQSKIIYTIPLITSLHT